MEVAITFAGLKKILSEINVPNDSIVKAQVVADDGSAWNMHLFVGDNGDNLLIHLMHPNLKTIPEVI